MLDFAPSSSVVVFVVVVVVVQRFLLVLVSSSRLAIQMLSQHINIYTQINTCIIIVRPL